MGRHRAPSPLPRRAAVAAVVMTAGGLSVSSSVVWPTPTPARAVEAPVPRLAVPAPVQSALVPAQASAASAPRPESVTVASGETLSTIARRHGQSWQELWRRNLDAVPDPDALRVGQRLSLVAPLAPLPNSVERPAPASTAAPGPVVVPEESVDEPAVEPVESEAVGLQGFIDAAMEMRGVPYRWGGKSEAGVDCSGLVYLALRSVGFTDTYRTSGALRDWVDPVSRANARAGDLVFGPGHVGIYLGDGMMIDAPRSGSVVGVRSVYSTMMEYGRIPT